MSDEIVAQLFWQRAQQNPFWKGVLLMIDYSRSHSEMEELASATAGCLGAVVEKGVTAYFEGVLERAYALLEDVVEVGPDITSSQARVFLHHPAEVTAQSSREWADLVEEAPRALKDIILVHRSQGPVQSEMVEVSQQYFQRLANLLFALVND